MSMRKQFVFHQSLLLALLVSLLLASQAVAQHPVDQFCRQFRKAVTDGDYATQGKLVDDNKDLSFSGFFSFEKSWASKKAAKDEEASEAEMNILISLAASYRTKHGSKFLSTRRLRIEKMTEEHLKIYLDAAIAAQDGYAVYQNGAADGNEESMQSAIKLYTKAAEGYLTIKDNFLAAQNAAFVGDSWKRSGAYFKSAYWYRKAAAPAQAAGVTARFPEINGGLNAMREKRQIEFPEIIDISLPIAESEAAYKKAVQARNTIEAGAGGTGESGAGASTKAKNIGTLTAPTSELAYEFVTDKGFKEKAMPLFSKIKVPYYNFAAFRPNNPSKGPFYQYMLLEKDKGFVDAGSFMPGAEFSYDGKVQFKGKGDKKAKTEKIKTKFSKFKKTVAYSGKSSRKITNMIIDWGVERKRQFGQAFRFQDEAKSKLLAWHGATGVVGKVRGQDVAILDCNGNGKFRDTGVDAVMIGKGSSARIEPLGRFIMLDGPGGRYPFEFKVNNNEGDQVRTRPFKGSLAPIIVDFKTASGARPDFLIVKGSGEDSEAYFDISKAIDEPMWIPPGKYHIHLGYFLFGSGKKQTHILITGGRSSALVATSGQLTTWALGGSGEYGFRMRGKFEAGEKPGEVAVTGKSIEVFGNHGEIYFNFLAERIAPLATVRKGSGTGSVLGKRQMKVVNDGQIVDLWYPSNVTIKNCGSNSSKRVGQLTCKHKILGSIVSDWIPVE